MKLDQSEVTNADSLSGDSDARHPHCSQECQYHSQDKALALGTFRVIRVRNTDNDNAEI